MSKRSIGTIYDVNIEQKTVRAIPIEDTMPIRVVYMVFHEWEHHRKFCMVTGDLSLAVTSAQIEMDGREWYADVELDDTQTHDVVASWIDDGEIHSVYIVKARTDTDYDFEV